MTATPPSEDPRQVARIVSTFVDAIFHHQTVMNHVDDIEQRRSLGKEIPLPLIDQLLASAGFELQTTRYVNANSELFPFRLHVSPRQGHRADSASETANGWLNAILGLFFPRDHAAVSRADANERVLLEVERSRPLPPIQLSALGHTFIEPPPSIQDGQYLVDHTRDEHNLAADVRLGVHAFCNNQFERLPQTAVLDCLRCRGCGEKFYILKTVRTYGDLRAHFLPPFRSLTPTRDQLVAAMLQDDPEYVANQRERGKADCQAGRRPTEFDGPYYEAYCDAYQWRER